jgi:hypothetical protein
MARRPPGGTRAQREGVIQRRKSGTFIAIKFRTDQAGGKAINRRLNLLKINIARKIVNKALKQAAKRFIQPAVNAGIATVSPGKTIERKVGHQPGLLKSKGTKVVKRSRKSTDMGYLVVTPSRTDLNIQGDKPPYYPLLLEYGWKGVDGKHFMRRARDQGARRAKTFLRRTILKFIEAEVDAMVRKGKGAKLFRSDRQIASFKKRGVI